MVSELSYHIQLLRDTSIGYIYILFNFSEILMFDKKNIS